MCRFSKLFITCVVSLCLVFGCSGLSVGAADKQIYTLSYEETARLFGYTSFQVATSSRVTVPYLDPDTGTYTSIYSPSMWYTNYTLGSDRYIGVRFYVNRNTMNSFRTTPYSITCNFPTSLTLRDMYDFTLGAGFLSSYTGDPKPNEYWYALFYADGTASSKFSYFSTPYTFSSLVNADTASKSSAVLSSFSPEESTSPIYDMYTTGSTTNFELVFQGCNHNQLSTPYDDAGIFDGYSYIFLRCPTITADADTISDLQIALGTKEPEPEEETDYSEGGPLGWIGSKISALGSSIINGISDIFIPDQDFLDEKFAKLKDKFSFWESIADTWRVFLNLIESTDFSEPPVVTVHISNYQGRYDFGDQATILDLSWYAPFKDAGDLMINAFIWLFFLWNLFRRLPEIISGSGMMIDRMSDVYVD